MNQSLPIRQPCPPGACNCGREELLDNAQADHRILLLTRNEEKRMLERLENLESLEHLYRMQQRMEQQLGIRLSVEPGYNEVRSMRGIQVLIDEQPGLCRKTRQAIPTAIRRSLEKRPEIAYSLLNAHDLLRDT
ncbi:hypothetical protein [Pseudomonas sp. TTU2014-080ASC]|uniref:hypothetical protein n=1 Tax=Pseudomonas sp. TTU2014-080ASC TaxID=1729724 RepID=UPI0007187044|nr:hypothetical protein [Pseudomonas sp. TTU2014-080ASC]KRW61912.1 ribosomal protein S3AE [Pseudomonas sp. TTU2014-080ASC]